MAPRAKLNGKTIAVLSTHGFEQSELVEPVEALRREGAIVHVVAPESGSIRGWNDGDWGMEVDVDTTIEEADPASYDALVLPGGVMNPDKLRMREDARRFVREFFRASGARPTPRRDARSPPPPSPCRAPAMWSPPPCAASASPC